MDTTEKHIPNFAYEDLLFQRRLQRNLNSEQEKLNALLAEHVRLLEARRKLMSEAHEAVQQRWDTGGAAVSNDHSAPETRVDGDGN